MVRRCSVINCNKVGVYGNLGEINVITQRRVVFCSEHRKPGMLNLTSRKCEYNGCQKQPIFGKNGSHRARFCCGHKEPGMIDIKGPHCQAVGCGKSATFAEIGANKAQFCTTHKTSNMIDVKNKRCSFSGCLKKPFFAKEGNSPQFCVEHKSPDMVDVLNEKCNFVGCKKRPCFANEAEPKICFCSEHKTPSMVDIKHKRCSFVGCKTSPSFAHPGNRRAQFCATHKEPNMVIITTKHCQFVGCTKYSRYARDGEHSAQFCFEHREPDMVDVKHMKCKFENCKSQATFGPIYSPARHCATHKEPNEWRYRHPKCAIENCTEKPTWTHQSDNYPTYCESHAAQIPNAHAIANLQCTICCQPKLCDAKTNICASCAGLAQPRAWHKIREEQMAISLQAAQLIPTSADKRLDSAAQCDIRARPDFLFQRAKYSLIIEVDEHQHARQFIESAPYSCECEFARMVNVHTAIGTPTIFIRFNPDSYTDINNHKHRADNAGKRATRVVHYTQNLIQFYDTNPLCDGLYVLYFYYNGAQPDNGHDAVPDKLRIDYFNHRVEPWIS